MTLSLTNSRKERAKTHPVPLYDCLIWFIFWLFWVWVKNLEITFALSQLCQWLKSWKFKPLTLIQYRIQQETCGAEHSRLAVDICQTPPQHCPNLKSVQKQSEERAHDVHLALKAPRLPHMGLQCGAFGTSWFTFSETVFDGMNVSEKIHLDTRYPGLSTRTLQCSLDQRHSLLMLYICKSQHIVSNGIVGFWRRLCGQSSFPLYKTVNSLFRRVVCGVQSKIFCLQCPYLSSQHQHEQQICEKTNYSCALTSTPSLLTNHMV